MAKFWFYSRTIGTSQQAQTCPHESSNTYWVQLSDSVHFFWAWRLQGQHTTVGPCAHEGIYQWFGGRMSWSQVLHWSYSHVVLQVWIKVKCKKYCSTVKVLEDEECINSEKTQNQDNMLCIFLMVFWLFFLEIQYMLVGFLAGNCHTLAKFKAMKVICRIIICISSFAVLTWPIKTLMEKQVSLLLEIMSLLF